ncbi:GIY-YIG nuclease family protein [Pseudomonas stutzeri]|jgi:hypothetical protein|uniref:GIY-YIG nuclease family protein n=1 Tax=Stutzerimonas stutzeri TaxID=316 RepID=UPI00210968C1|nr:GIY-YIG nuclease family protein [Stutzerimonas stutzeri]MCQ4292083.1 GIY-YIG nuclease family protein [Stutzerimonas stutzeri]
MLTPSKYWRLQCDLDCEINQPSSEFRLPDQLAAQAQPPARGHGLAIAAYSKDEQMGLLRWIGIIQGGSGLMREVDWMQTSAQIWVDSAKGRSFWEAGAFGFAPKKIADYGLHELWKEHFPGLELRAAAPMAAKPKASERSSTGKILPERLTPVEVVGNASSGAKAGVVYVLKSAYGYKVGRTKNVPDRMRAFGVKLPFMYTIPLCAWFDDCHEAEHRYHRIFECKRINGEWFDLDENDLQMIRLRA